MIRSRRARKFLMMKKLQSSIVMLILVLTIFSSFNFAFQTASGSPPATGDKAFTNTTASFTSGSNWNIQPTTNLKLWANNNTTANDAFTSYNKSFSVPNKQVETYTTPELPLNNKTIASYSKNGTVQDKVVFTFAIHSNGKIWNVSANLFAGTTEYQWSYNYSYGFSGTFTMYVEMLPSWHISSPSSSTLDIQFSVRAANLVSTGYVTLDNVSTVSGITANTVTTTSPTGWGATPSFWGWSYIYKSISSSYSLLPLTNSYTLNWTSQQKTNTTYNSLTEFGATSGHFSGSMSVKSITFQSDFIEFSSPYYLVSYFLNVNTTAPTTYTYSSMEYTYSVSQNGNFFNSSLVYFNYSEPSGASSSYSISYKLSITNITLTNPNAPIEQISLPINDFTYFAVSKYEGTLDITAYANYSSAQSASVKFDTSELVNYYPTIVSTSIGWTGVGSQAELTVNAENIGNGYSFSTESLEVVNVNWGDGSALGSSAVQYGAYDWGFYHNYTSAGTYTVSFQVVNYVGNVNSLSKSATGSYTVTATITTAPNNNAVLSTGQNIWFNYSGVDAGLTSLTLTINGIEQFQDSFQSSTSQSVNFAPTYSGLLDVVWEWAAGKISGSISLTYQTSTYISPNALFVLVNFTYSGSSYSNYVVWSGTPIAYNLTYSYYTWTYNLAGESSSVTVKGNPTWQFVTASPAEVTYYPSNATADLHIAQTQSISITFLIKDPPQPASFQITYYPTSAIDNFFGASLSFSDLHTYVNGNLLESDFINAIIGDSYTIKAYDLMGDLVVNTTYYVQYQTSFDDIPIAIYPVTISNQNSTYELGLNVSTNGFSQNFPYISPSGTAGSGYTVWVISGTYYFNFTYVNPATYQVYQTVPLLRTISEASFINIAGVTISQLAISQQRNAQNYTNLVETVNITFANEYSKIYNETVGVNVNVNNVNASVNHLITETLVNVSFIRSYILGMNNSLDVQFSLTNDIIKSFQSNVTVFDTYFNNTIQTIKSLEVQFNSNLTLANDSIKELNFLSEQTSTYLHTNITNELVSTLQNVTNIYTYVKGMNVTQLDYLTALQTTVNSIRSNITVTDSFINDTVTQVDSYMNTVENVILSNITTNTYSITTRENVIKNLVSFELEQQNASLSYKLLFGTPQIVNGSIYEFSVFVQDLKGGLANFSITKEASKNLSLFYESGNTTHFLNFSVQDIKAGSFEILVSNLNQSEVNNIKGNQALVQAESEVKTGASAYTAVGIAGSSQFYNMKGLAGYLSFLGFKTPPPKGIIPEIKWFFSSAIGIPSSVLISGIVGFYYVWRIEEDIRNKNREKEKEEKREETDKKVDEMHDILVGGAGK